MSRIADWPYLFGYIITATGWTRAEVEELTLQEANELLAHWSEHPPAHVLLASMIKSRPLRKSQPSKMAMSGAPRDLVSAVTAIGGKVSSVPAVQMQALLKSEHKGHEVLTEDTKVQPPCPL